MLQNILIVIASYTFYGWWDYRFLVLIIFSSVLDYFIGIALDQEEKRIKKKILLWTSVLVNIGLLGYFKYYNFFVENFTTAFSLFGLDINPNSLNIILPVGISFYTFQTLSYTIDIYKGNTKATNNFIAYAAFVSFFPQLVAGPIERAKQLLPQFEHQRNFDYSKAADGMRQILWGLFQKVVIADNCAPFVDHIFNYTSYMNGSALLIGALLFSFQIYCDFAGYSNIAIGTARLFGIDLMQNFAYPYFSRSIAEFWRRWHISLSTWFRDYLYIPLGGSRVNSWKLTRNIFITFIVSGFWHGANWTFIVWGALNAIYFLPLILSGQNRRYLDITAKGKYFPSPKETLSMIITFAMTVYAWIFFRAEDITHALNYISIMFSKSIFDKPIITNFDKDLSTIFILIAIFMVIEWLGREDRYAIENIGLNWKRSYRYAMYNILFLLILWFSGDQHQFIYFQF